MKLIEKIVDKVLANEFYAFGLTMSILMFISILCGFSSTAYKEKLDAEIKLAQIAAGYFECGSNCKCK